MRTNDDLRDFPLERQEDAIQVMEEALPDEGELALLSYTGGKAFGWGIDTKTDWDAKGFFVYPDWFYKCHVGGNISLGMGGYDMTIFNITSFEDPRIRYRRWKLYYDCAQPFYIHDEFDYWSDFMDHVKPETIEHIYPHELQREQFRMELEMTGRSVSHCYKEHMIPLYFLETGKIESDCIKINKHFDFDGFKQACEAYRGPNDVLEWDVINDEIDWMFSEIAEQLDQENPGSGISLNRS